jgi:hypothetical protein
MSVRASGTSQPPGFKYRNCRAGSLQVRRNLRTKNTVHTVTDSTYSIYRGAEYKIKVDRKSIRFEYTVHDKRTRGLFDLNIKKDKKTGELLGYTIRE